MKKIRIFNFALEDWTHNNCENLQKKYYLVPRSIIFALGQWKYHFITQKDVVMPWFSSFLLKNILFLSIWSFAIVLFFLLNYYYKIYIIHRVYENTKAFIITLIRNPSLIQFIKPITSNVKKQFIGIMLLIHSTRFCLNYVIILFIFISR